VVNLEVEDSKDDGKESREGAVGHWFSLRVACILVQATLELYLGIARDQTKLASQRKEK
jgi:hypothetical protein